MLSKEQINALDGVPTDWFKIKHGLFTPGPHGRDDVTWILHHFEYTVVPRTIDTCSSRVDVSATLAARNFFEPPEHIFNPQDVKKPLCAYSGFELVRNIAKSIDGSLFMSPREGLQQSFICLNVVDVNNLRLSVNAELYVDVSFSAVIARFQVFHWSDKLHKPLK